MRVLHSGSLDVISGGPALSTYLILKGLEEQNVDTNLLMLPLEKGKKLIAEDVKISYTTFPFERKFGFVPHLENTVASLGVYDLYHVQGMWQYLGHGLASYARRVRKPYLLTLRGMMYPQALRKSTWIKRVSLALYQKKDLMHAACIHATCIEEKDFYRDLGFTNPVAVIPNPMDCSKYLNQAISVNDKIRIGYLGRIHPRKRIERLLYVFDRLRQETENCELLIIGGGDEVYENFLKREVGRMQLTNVRFTGFLTGNMKDEALASLAFLVVPSDFENFGNIITEALVRGVPVIASKGTPWQELESHHCGWWIDNDVDTLIFTMKEALSLSEEKRLSMGMRGKELIEEKYSVEVVAKKMRRLYNWIIEGGEKPEFIY